MNPHTIPFHNFHIDDVVGRAVVENICEIIKLKPCSSLDIQKISNVSDATPADVKKILYYLFYKGVIKAKYTVYHKECGYPISRPLPSLGEIFLEDYIDNLCSHCPDPVSDTSELEIRMYFWGKESI